MLPQIRQFLVCAGCLLAFGSAAASFTEWQFTQTLPVSQPGLVKLSLASDTLNSARPDLADLRILDKNGREVPYAVEVTQPERKLVRSASSFRVELEQNATIISLQPGLNQPLGSIELFSPAVNFIKAAAVSGSQDNQNWKSLTTGQPIFRQPGSAGQMRLALPAGSWNYIRITIDDHASPPIPFTGANVEASAVEPAPKERVSISLLERTEDGSLTRFTLDLGAAHLRLASIAIESPERWFRRYVNLSGREIEDNNIREKALASGWLFRVAVPGQEPSAQLSLPVDAQVPGREATLTIENGDSPPLQISALRAERRPVYLIFFAGEAGAYQLLTGNRLCPAPKYDLATLGIDLKSAPLTPSTISPMVANPGFKAPEPLAQVPSAGPKIALDDWKFRKPVKLATAGVQRLDLDLEVLANAQSSLADLRLIRGDRQIPFVKERTASLRPLKPEVARQDDPRQPKLSRWLLKAPLTGLPLTRLTCSSPAALFQRTVVLYEEPMDNRGAKYRRELGSTTWTRTSQSTSQKLTLEIQSKPLTDSLWLETDNQDNPAIELANFEFSWPLTRLFFKAEQPDQLFLFYGNDAAQPPQYDLSLVADQLLQANKSEASLGPQERLKAVSWKESHKPGQGSWVFWTVLGLVVVALLFIIGRLMPKQQP